MANSGDPDQTPRSFIIIIVIIIIKLLIYQFIFYFCNYLFHYVFTNTSTTYSILSYFVQFRLGLPNNCTVVLNIELSSVIIIITPQTESVFEREGSILFSSCSSVCPPVRPLRFGSSGGGV